MGADSGLCSSRSSAYRSLRAVHYAEQAHHRSKRIPHGPAQCRGTISAKQTRSRAVALRDPVRIGGLATDLAWTLDLLFWPNQRPRRLWCRRLPPSARTRFESNRCPGPNCLRIRHLFASFYCRDGDALRIDTRAAVPLIHAEVDGLSDRVRARRRHWLACCTPDRRVMYNKQRRTRCQGGHEGAHSVRTAHLGAHLTRPRRLRGVVAIC